MREGFALAREDMFKAKLEAITSLLPYASVVGRGEGKEGCDPNLGLHPLVRAPEC